MTVSQSSAWRVFAALAVAGCFGLFAAPSRAQADPPSLGTSAIDPADAAREVFEDSGFWWKRIEPPRPMSASLSWLPSLFQAPWEAICRVLGKIAEAIARFLARLLGAFGGKASDATTGVLLIVAGLVAWSSWKLYPVVVRWLTAGRPVRITHESSAWQPLAEASDLFDQAGQALRDGRHAEAIRLALLALIARLEKQGLLRYDTTRTNREYQKELRNMAELSATFGQLAKVYDRVWYGGAPAGRGDAERAILLCRSLINREDHGSE